jgi:hypothetical protein
MTNQQVVNSWLGGKPANSGNMHTNGKDLFSYALRIGKTRKGEKILLDYRGKVSVTTSCHCGLAVAGADRIEEPKR